ncbi:MAG TPA: hypothetical protein VFF13_01615 [archaeon]|nr:hypothetical protein [archaeon]
MPPFPKHAAKIAAALRRAQLDHPIFDKRGKRIPGQIPPDAKLNFHKKLLYEFIEEKPFADILMNPEESDNSNKIREYALEKSGGDKEKAREWLKAIGKDFRSKVYDTKKLITEHGYFDRVSPNDSMTYKDHTIHLLTGFSSVISNKIDQAWVFWK